MGHTVTVYPFVVSFGFSLEPNQCRLLSNNSTFSQPADGELSWPEDTVW